MCVIVLYCCHGDRNIECVDMMISEGCQISARDKLGRTPLHYATATAQYQCVLSLVANGASLTVTDNFKRTPLHYAATADGDAKLVDMRWAWFWVGVVLGILSVYTSSLVQAIFRNRTLSNDTFVYLTTSEMRTPHYPGHFNLTQWCLD